MIPSFGFSGMSPLKFGVDAVNDLPKQALQFSDTILLITGQHSLLRTGKLETFLEGCRSQHGTVHHSIQNHEPSPQDIDSIVDEYRDQEIELVISIGGGSVLDCGKAVAAMLTVDGSVTDYLEGVGTKTHPGTTVAHIAVPTTAGTGSEATKNAVISKTGTNGFKKSLRHHNFIPDLVIIDPALMTSCPPAVTAACGMDAVTQLLESYVSTNASPLTDALALAGLEKVGKNIVAACSDRSEDTHTRGEIALAAYFSGITLANAGLGVVHGLASPVGAFTDIPHGIVCGTLLAPAVEVTIRELLKSGPGTAFSKFATVARIFFPNQKDDKRACHQLIEKLYDMTTQLRIQSLGEYGITRSDCIHLAQKGGNKNNPVTLTTEQIEEILLKRV